MTVKMLGTAAHEGIPAPFCCCDNCNYAREHGGKNIRMRSGVLIDDDIRIDFSPDAYAQSFIHGVNMAEVEHLLISHSHADHFTPSDLEIRCPPYGHFDFAPLRVYGNQAVEDKYLEASKYWYAHKHHAEANKSYIGFMKISPFDVFQLDEDTTVTALQALHNREEDCMVYLIERGNKTVMYGYDSGIYPELTWQSLADKYIDVILMDCTFGGSSDGFNHMGLPDNAVIRERMLSSGIADENTRFVSTHFSHNEHVSHEDMADMADKYGLTCAYDGMEIIC